MALLTKIMTELSEFAFAMLKMLETAMEFLHPIERT